MQYKNYGSMINTPHAFSNRFELPTLNVKEVSPRLLNRYRDRRMLRNYVSASVDLSRQSLTPMRMRADGEGPQTSSNLKQVREAARYEAEQSGDYLGQKHTMISI